MKIGLIPAAGMARRLGISIPKELLTVRRTPVIDYSVDHLVEAGVDRIIVVIRDGKEAIRSHLEQKYVGTPIDFTYQTGPIGNLIDAIKCSYRSIQGRQVYFSMADTIVSPNPFLVRHRAELTLLCFEAASDRWKNFGVVDRNKRKVVDKPQMFVGNVCWGALMWQPSVSDLIMRRGSLPDVINCVRWDHFINIDSYWDIGLRSELDDEQWRQIKDTQVSRANPADT